jgi:cell wall-associated NlpC family hydrolase
MQHGVQVIHAAFLQRVVWRTRRGPRDFACSAAFRRANGLCNSVQGVPWEGVKKTGANPMVSLVSVISVNLISLASPRVDSARVLATTATTPASVNASVDVGATSSRSMPSSIVATAARFLGTRYRLGGTSPSAFDCSGFVRYVFARHGVTLPRTAKEQSVAGHSIVVGPDSLRVGDLLFFRTTRGRASHVAIYAGNGRIIHASSGSRRIRYDDLGSARGRWFIEHLTSVRRILDDSGIGNVESGIEGGAAEVSRLRLMTRATG